MDGPAASSGGEQAGEATRHALLAWAGEVACGRVTRWQEIAGGNRCRSWAVDVTAPDGTVAELYLRYQPPRPPSAEPYTVWREARFYRALIGSTVPAPRLLAVHGAHQAILTERVRGRADFRRIVTKPEQIAIAREFIAALAAADPLLAVGGAGDVLEFVKFHGNLSNL